MGGMVMNAKTCSRSLFFAPKLREPPAPLHSGCMPGCPFLPYHLAYNRFSFLGSAIMGGQLIVASRGYVFA